MNTTISAIEAAITAFLHERGVLEPVVNLEKPVDFKFGDIATSVALKYAKQLQENPVAIAEAICAHLLDAQIAAIAGATVAKPGFINITLSPAFFSALLADIAAAGAAYGTNTQLAGQKWVIEHTSPIQIRPCILVTSVTTW